MHAEFVVAILVDNLQQEHLRSDQAKKDDVLANGNAAAPGAQFVAPAAGAGIVGQQAKVADQAVHIRRRLNPRRGGDLRPDFQDALPCQPGQAIAIHRDNTEARIWRASCFSSSAKRKGIVGVVGIVSGFEIQLSAADVGSQVDPLALAVLPVGHRVPHRFFGKSDNARSIARWIRFLTGCELAFHCSD